MKSHTLTSKRIRCGSQTAKKLLTHDKYIRVAGGVSTSLILLLGIVMVCPIVSSSTQALDNTTRAASSTVTVDAAATLAVSLDPKVDMEISPESAGTFSYGVAKLGIMTNNPTGYSIYMQTADGNSTLNSDKVTGGQTINSITTNTVGSSFTGNTWGYTIDTNTVSEGSTYKPIPTNSNTAIETTDTSTNADSYNLGFGAHIDNTLASGAYYNDVLVSVVANPKVISSLSDLNFMQDMNSSICANTTEGYTKQLIDTRDNKSYWVAKMKDGNCWMTSNLAYEFNTNNTLTPNDSDVTSNWKIPNNALNIGQAGSDVTSGTNASTDMWKATTSNSDWQEDYGYYYSYGAATAGSGKTLTTDGQNAPSSICPKGWQLPVNGGDFGTANPVDKSYTKLLKAYDIDDNWLIGIPILEASPLNFAFSSFVYEGGSTNAFGASGDYQTATVSSDSSAYYFAFYRGDGIYFSGVSRSNGFTLRCVAR